MVGLLSDLNRDFMYPLTGEFRSDGRMENFLRMQNQVVMFGIEQKLSRRYKRAISVKEDVLLS